MIRREAVQCVQCECIQFRRETNLCRRCGEKLRSGSVESRTIVLVDRAAGKGPIRTMRDSMQAAAVQAIRELGSMAEAADALGIQHKRLKQLLREAGDVHDYRKDRRERVFLGTEKGRDGA